MGWDLAGDIKRAVEQVAAPVTRAVDNALSTNFSGENRGGMLARVSEDINRSDPARYVGGLATSAYRFTKAPLEVASDIARGDIKNAGTNIGRGVGALANTATLNASFIVNQNADALRSDEAKKWTLGLSDDLAGTASGMRTLEDQAYVSDADRNSALRLGSKVGFAYLAAPALASAAQTGYGYFQEGIGWITGGGAAAAGGAALYDALKTGAEKEGTKALQNAGILPKSPESNDGGTTEVSTSPSTYFNDGSAAGSGGPTARILTQSSNVSPAMAGAAVLAIVAFFYLKKGKI